MFHEFLINKNQDSGDIYFLSNRKGERRFLNIKLNKIRLEQISCNLYICTFSDSFRTTRFVTTSMPTTPLQAPSKKLFQKIVLSRSTIFLCSIILCDEVDVNSCSIDSKLLFFNLKKIPHGVYVYVFIFEKRNVEAGAKLLHKSDTSDATSLSTRNCDREMFAVMNISRWTVGYSARIPHCRMAICD